MGEQVMVDLKLIDPNPYQMRQAEDPTAVAELAASIQRSGLLERPSARRAGERWQLVFGHTRLAAFRLLAKQDSQYAQMPLEVVGELDDRQMFELGLAENLKRRQLNAIEVAHALKTYMDQFQATSEEAGELFGLQASTVRGKVRLLELPKPVQEKLAAGELSEGNARVVLAAQRILPKAELHAVIKNERLASRTESVIEHALDRSRAVKRVDNDALNAPMGRSGWPADMKARNFPHDKLPNITLAKAGQNYEHLISPPACTSCEFFVKVNNWRYCGLPLCFERKSKAWLAHQLEKAVEKTGIPAYEPAADGDCRKISAWDGEWKKACRGPDPDVRLVINDGWTNFEGLPRGIEAVWVGKKAKQGAQASDSGYNRHERERRLIAKRKRPMRQFLQTEVVPHFAAQLGLVPLPILDDLVNNAKPYDLPYEEADYAAGRRRVKADRARLQELAAWYSIWRRVKEDVFKKDTFVIDVLREVEAQAKEWGFTLPATAGRAAKDLNQTVAAETAAKKAKEKAKKARKKVK